MRTLGVSEARSGLTGILVRLRDDKQPIIIERRGKAMAALVTIEDLALIESRQDSPRSSGEAALLRAQRQARIGSWRWDVSANKPISFSEEYARIHGVLPEAVPALMEEQMERVIHPDDRGRVKAEFARFDAEGADYDIEYRIVRPDGEVRHVLEIGESICDKNGRPIEQTGTVQDITERKRAEEALRESEKRFRDFAEAASDWFWEMGPDLRFSWLSESYPRLLGAHGGGDPALRRESIIGKTRWDITSENVDNEKWRAHRADLEAHRAFRDFRYQIKLDHGVIAHRTVSAVPFFDAKGEFQGYRGTSSDITQLVEAEEALKSAYEDMEERVRERTAAFHKANQALHAREAQLKAFFDNSPAQIGIKDADGRYLLVNRVTAELQGLSAQEMEWKTPHEVFQPEVADQVVAHDKEVVEKGTPVESEVAGRWQGQDRIFQTVKFPIRDESGGLLGLGGIATDVTGERRAQKALRENEERFQDIVANVPGVVYQFKVDGEGHKSFPYVSSTIKGLFGLEADRVMQDASLWFDTVHSEDQARLAASSAESHGTLGPWLWEGRMIRSSGETGWFRASSTPRKLQDGGVLWNGIVLDVTESKRAEKALRENEARLASVLRQVKLAYWNYRFRDNVISRWSEEAANILGFAPEDLPKRYETYLDFVDPADRERVATTYGTLDPANPRRLPYKIEYRFVRPDGQTLWIQEVSELEFDPAGVLVGYQGTIQDVTAIKQAEEAVSNRDVWLRAILENSPIQITLKDTRGRIMAVSRNVMENLETSPERFIGYTSADFLPADVAAIYMAADSKVVETGLPIQQEITEDWSGVTRHYLNAKFPLKDDEGQVLGICSLTSDLTEAKQTEERLRQVQKMEAIGQLTGGVAHDFNNLLAVIQGNTELIFESTGRENAGVQAILRASARGAELTQRLLAFSRQQSLRPQSFDLANLVNGLFDMLRLTLGARVEVESVVEPGLWPALADPGQVENAILNLAINARDAMPRGGRLAVACSNVRVEEADIGHGVEALPGDYVAMAVSDDGLGMSSEVLSHVFEPFFTTKEVGAGSGLGLSMVYGFAQQSGGFVSLYSEEGRGTSVILHLPRAGLVSPSSELETQDVPPRGRGEVLLVIEDDQEVRSLAVRMLSSLGYQVIEAPEAASARAILDRREHVDLVLSDVVLPGGLSGPEFAQEAKDRYPKLKFIFMSGFPREAAIRHGFVAADRVLLSKPFQMRQLANALRTELDR